MVTIVGGLGLGIGGGGEDLWELGPPGTTTVGQNTFADNAARDAYFGGNAQALANYDAQPRFFIQVGAAPNYQLQTRRGSAWVNLTTVVRGDRGPRGPMGTAGAPGSDANVNAANVATALGQLTSGQITTVRTHWAIDAANLAVQLNALPQGSRIDYADLDNQPTIPTDTDIYVSGISVDEASGVLTVTLTRSGTGSPAALSDSVTLPTGGGTTPPPAQTHSLLFAIGANSGQDTFTAADFTASGRSASASTGMTVTTPTWTGNRHFAIAVPSTRELVTATAPNFLGNLVDDMTKASGTLTVNSETVEVWVSNNALGPSLGGQVLTITTRAD